MLQSLRSRIAATMALLILLVLLIAVIGVNAITSLGRTADQQLGAVVQGSRLSTGLVGTATAEVRAAEQYLARPDPADIKQFMASGDSAYDYQRQFRDLAGLTTEDQLILNQMATSQAEAEVAYARAHALADVGKTDEARAAAALAEGPSNALLTDVARLSTAQGERARAQA
ncbi:MAG TPA: hypothetical protein VF151_00670, partial [Gemmatimonadales bacterium]